MTFTATDILKPARRFLLTKNNNITGTVQNAPLILLYKQILAEICIGVSSSALFINYIESYISVLIGKNIKHRNALAVNIFRKKLFRSSALTGYCSICTLFIGEYRLIVLNYKALYNRSR